MRLKNGVLSFILLVAFNTPSIALNDLIPWIEGAGDINGFGDLGLFGIGSILIIKAYGGPSAIGSASPKAIAAAATDGAPALNFQGNTLAQGFVVNGGVRYPILLLRQGDCSLTEFVASSTGLTPTIPGLEASLPGAQDYLHQVAGLATTPDRFPKGCVDPVLGVPGRVMEYVGQSNAGTYLFADAGATSNDLIVYRVAADFTLTSQTLATNVGGIVVVADVNKDGFNDLVATGITDAGTNATGIGVFISNHDGTFQAPVVYPVSGFGQITVDDVNGDGNPDILVAALANFNATSETLTTLLGKGDGTFTVGPASDTGNITQATIVTGDFRGIGKKDAIVGNVLMKGNGDGSFTAAAGTLPFGGFGTLVTGDFNGDGKLDVAALPFASGALSIFLGNGNGTFTPGASYSAIVGGEHLIVTDIDGDGNQDIVVGLGGNGAYFGDAGSNGVFQVLMGRGDGTLVGAPAMPAIATAVAAADFTGDGKADLLSPLANTTGVAPSALAVAPGDGSGRFGNAIVTNIAIVPSVVAAAELNGDGKMDAVVAGFSGPLGYQIVAVFGNGNGTFGKEQDYLLPGPPIGIATGDFNGDGHPDIAVATSTRLGGAGQSGVYVLLGKTDGTFAAPVQVDAAHSASIAAADVSGEGRADLVVADFGNHATSTPGTVRVYLGNADGSFTAKTASALQAAGTPAFYFTAVAVADMNKDGKPDIVLGAFDASFSAQLVVLNGVGDGTYPNGVSAAILGGGQDPVTAIAVADFDGDGNADVAFALNDYMGIVSGGGDGTLVKQGAFAISGQSVALLATDLNGDGKKDIVALGASGAVALVNAAVATTPGAATVLNNTYGAMSVAGGTLNGNTISALQSNAVIQLGNTAGTPGSYLELDFQGLGIGAGNTLTVRSGASNQTVHVRNAGGVASVIGGTLQAQGGGGAAAPLLYVEDPNGLTVAPGGNVSGPSGLIVSGLGASWTVGQPVINQGVVDGGPSLDVSGLKIGGGGQFKGDGILLSTITFANNPVNGSHFLSNGLQLYPSTGTDVALTLHAYGPAPQVLNIKINGNGSAWMPSAWNQGSSAPSNNAVIPAGGSRPSGTPEPAYGGGSMIVQATGSLQIASGPTNDFVFPGAIVFKAGGTLDLNAVVINQGWTVTGKQFQGVFFESPNIVSPAGNIQVLTNNPNWVNFSTLPLQHVGAFSLTANAGGGASYTSTDAVSTHLNTYSATIEAAANGQCWLCLINATPVDLR